jgi:hypothetical protein
VSASAAFLAGLGTYLSAQIPAYAGRVRYDYWYDPIQPDAAGLPILNLLWDGDQLAPQSNMHNGPAILSAQVKIAAYLPHEVSHDAVGRGEILDAASLLRSKLAAAHYTHVNGAPIAAVQWVSVDDIVTQIHSVPLPTGLGYTVVACVMSIKLRVGWDEP